MEDFFFKLVIGLCFCFDVVEAETKFYLLYFIYLIFQFSTMKIIHRILTTRVLVPIFTFSIGCFLTNVFSNLSCSTDARPNVAPKKECFLVILILSAPDNIERRNAIRESWLNLRPHHNSTNRQRIFIPTYDRSGWLIQESIEEQVNSLEVYKSWLKTRQFTDQSKTVKVIHKFVIGTAELTRTRQQQIRGESKTYNDLLLFDNFQDSYKNLTKKLLVSLQSISESHSFHYLLKCDDDTYVRLDMLLVYLLDYNDQIKSIDFRPNPQPQLYWGYFNGRAHIKTHGQWKETHFNLCSKYLPYALGGGYVISERLVQYVHSNADILSSYMSEDISVGIWFSSMRNVYRKHDCRFDTAYMARVCKDYHIVLHKRSAEDMRRIYQDTSSACNYDRNVDDLARPVEYFYNWKAAPMQCCDTLVNWFAKITFFFVSLYLIFINYFSQISALKSTIGSERLIYWIYHALAAIESKSD